jgi:DNA-binding transcriptional regulator YbjK
MSATQVPAARSEHGAERRSLIIDATVALLTREGIGAVTHRAVAREADVPLAATTYYFESKDELITEALERLVTHEVDVFEERSNALGASINSPEALAVALADVLTSRGEDERRMALAQFEVYLEAARRPALRAPVARWIETFTQLSEVALVAAGAPDPKERAPVMVAAIDGILMHALTHGLDSAGEAEVRDRVERLVLTLTCPT